MDKPKCFNIVDWKRYVAAARGTKLPKGSLFCRDCTPQYQKTAIESGNCEYPDTIFRTIKKGTEDEEIIGIRRP